MIIPEETGDQRRDGLRRPAPTRLGGCARWVSGTESSPAPMAPHEFLIQQTTEICKLAKGFGSIASAR